MWFYNNIGFGLQTISGVGEKVGRREGWREGREGGKVEGARDCGVNLGGRGRELLREVKNKKFLKNALLTMP